VRSEVVAEASGEATAIESATSSLIRRKRQPNLPQPGYGKRGWLRGGQEPTTYRYFVSDVPLRFQTIGERFLGRSLGGVERVDW